MLVTNLLQTKEVNSLKDVAQEISFELSATELLNLKTIIVCICRSPNADYNKFLHKLELLIGRVQTNWNRLILCGDWNINFLRQISNVHDLQNLFLITIWLL